MEIHIAECLLNDNWYMGIQTKFIVTLFIIVLCTPIWAEDTVDPCAQYFMTVSLHGDNTLTYSLVKSQVYEEPYVDSVWITGTGEDSVIVYITSHAQPREKIDVSSLPLGRYFCFAYIGDCATARLFIARPGESVVTDNFIPRTDQQLLISPNPVNSILHIQTSDELSQVNIYTLNDQCVLQTSQTDIDVSALPKGMYILRASTTDGKEKQAKFLAQ